MSCRNRAFVGIAGTVGIDPTAGNAKRLAAKRLTHYGRASVRSDGAGVRCGVRPRAMIKALDQRFAEYVNDGWSFGCSCLGAPIVSS